VERFGSKPQDKQERRVLVMMDHSLSMEYSGDGLSRREKAIHEALKVLGTLGANDWVNVVLIDQNPAACFVEFSRNHTEAARFLRALTPGLTRADLPGANSLASRLLSQKGPGAEVYFLSDFQRKNWSNAGLNSLPPEVRLFFVDVAGDKSSNRAILDARPTQSSLLAGDTVPLEITLGNFSAEPFRDTVKVVLQSQLTFEQEVSLAPWSSGKFLVPLPAGGPGKHRCEVQLPTDGLEADNHYVLTWNVLEKEEVLIVTEAPDSKREASYFLKTALNPFENRQGSFHPQILPLAEFNSTRLAGVRKLFFTRIGRLSEAAVTATAGALLQGAGLIYFLDGEHDAENLKALEEVMGTGAIPLRLAQKKQAKQVASGTQQIVRGDFKSRYLKLFKGATRQDLGLMEFYDYYQASATGSGGILLSYADESPAMAVASPGLGTVVLLNFSVNEFSSNVARQRVFPAWIQELTKAMSAEDPPPASYLLGESVMAEVWKEELKDAEVKDPRERKVPLKRDLVAERYSISFIPDQLGFYELTAAQTTGLFGVNVSPDESDLRSIDRASLPSFVPDAASIHFLDGQNDFEEAARGRPVFHWFLLGGLVVLLGETAVQLAVRKGAA
jgi:hypothetical protein